MPKVFDRVTAVKILTICANMLRDYIFKNYGKNFTSCRIGVGAQRHVFEKRGKQTKQNFVHVLRKFNVLYFCDANAEIIFYPELGKRTILRAVKLEYLFKE